MNSHSLVLSEHAQHKADHTVERDGANATSIVDNTRGRFFNPNLVDNSNFTELNGPVGGDLR